MTTTEKPAARPKVIRIGGEPRLLGRLLPRDLNPAAGDETVTLIHSLLTEAHLDRRAARAHGWRGVRPSFTQRPAWTARIAERDAIFGLVFEEEAVHENELLLGTLRLYVFPDPDHPDLASRPKPMRADASSPEWPNRIRALSDNVDSLEAYAAGVVELGVRLDGAGVELTYTAPREIAFTDASGCRDGRLRPLTDGLPFFAALAETLRGVFPPGTPDELVLWAEPDPEHPTALVSITLAAGAFTGLLPGRRMRALPFKHRPHEEEMSRKPVVHVLSGFLGAGKTTFLQQWLEYLNNRERFTGVIQNEFGEVDLDTLLLRGQTRIEAIDEGCVCCTLADSLRPGLLRLLKALPADQIIIETTGIAHPNLVMDALWVLNDIASRGLLITVVDAYDLSRRPETLDDSDESDEAACRRIQIDHADVLVCAKADAVTDEALADLQAQLAKRNPAALILAADHGSVPFGVLDAFFLHALDRRLGRLTSREGPAAPGDLKGGPLHFAAAAPEGGSASRYETFVLRDAQARSASGWRMLIEAAGPGVSRVKGIVNLEGHGPFVLQYAAGTLDFQPLPPAPGSGSEAGSENGRQTPDSPERFLVFIGRGLEEARTAALAHAPRT